MYKIIRNQNSGVHNICDIDDSCYGRQVEVIYPVHPNLWLFTSDAPMTEGNYL